MNIQQKTIPNTPRAIYDLKWMKIVFFQINTSLIFGTRRRFIYVFLRLIFGWNIFTVDGRLIDGWFVTRRLNSILRIFISSIRSYSCRIFLFLNSQLKFIVVFFFFFDGNSVYVIKKLIFQQYNSRIKELFNSKMYYVRLCFTSSKQIPSF